MKLLSAIIAFSLFLTDSETRLPLTNYQSLATDLDSGNELYREIHTNEFENLKIAKSVSEYIDMSGGLISKRIMNFEADSTNPNYTLEDFRSGYLEGAEVIDKGLVKVFMKTDSSSKMETEVLEIDSPYVIDGGLTYFFRKHWSRLLNGETVEFNFVTPSKLDYFSFRVSKNSIRKLGTHKGMEIILEPSSFIIRQFVDPIYITYDLDTKHILLYKGISNINNDEGKSYNVKIDYYSEY